MLRIEALHHVMKQSPDEIRLDLHPGLAKSGRGDGVLSGQGQAEGATLVPKGIQERTVAASSGVGDEEEKEGDKDLGREWTAPREVLLAAPERGRILAGHER